MVDAFAYQCGCRFAVYELDANGNDIGRIGVTTSLWGLARWVLEEVGHTDYRTEPIYPTEEAEAYAIMATFADYEPTEEDLAYMLAEDEAVRNNYRVKA